MVLLSIQQPTGNQPRYGKVPMRVRACLVGIAVLASVVFLSIAKGSEDPFARFDAEVARRVEEVRALEEGRFLIEGLENLRIAAFGSSLTWGAGLSSKDLAYPHTISAHTDNYAMLSGGPNYPGVCAQTLIGNEKKYDLILLEYWLNAEQGLGQLATKLRRRFPNAFIITVKIEGPTHAKRKDPDTKKVATFAEWRDGLGLEETQDILTALEADTGDWFFPTREGADHHIKEIHDDVHAYRVRLPRRDTPKSTLALYLQWFEKGQIDMKPIGHEMLADMIRGTIETKLHFGSVDQLMAKSENLGSWGKGDSCHFWPTKESFTEDYSDSLHLKRMNRFSDKIALEVHGPGNFTVTNSFFNQRTLFISYLTSTKSYKPQSLSVKIGTLGVAHNLDPSAARTHHPIRTIALGFVPPGKRTIFVDLVGEPLDDFPRIVGVTLSDEKVTPREYGFYPHFH